MTINTWMDRMDKLLKSCPPGYWLFAAGGGLHVMKYDSGGKVMTDKFGCMDPKAIVGNKLTGVYVDGGDW
jgi:hypothetical protein